MFIVQHYYIFYIFVTDIFLIIKFTIPTRYQPPGMFPNIHFDYLVSSV